MYCSAYRAIGQFHGSAFKAWLMRILTNTCYDQLRRQRRHPTVPLEPMDSVEGGMDFASFIADPADLPQQQVEARELQSAILQGLQKLDPKYRAVAVLVDLEGLSYEEAAEVLNIPVGTVKSRLARGRLALRTYLRRFPALLPRDLVQERSRVSLEELV